MSHCCEHCGQGLLEDEQPYFNAESNHGIEHGEYVFWKSEIFPKGFRIGRYSCSGTDRCVEQIRDLSNGSVDVLAHVHARS
jgi:hypothetical protein